MQPRHKKPFIRSEKRKIGKRRRKARVGRENNHKEARKKQKVRVVKAENFP